MALEVGKLPLDTEVLCMHLVCYQKSIDFPPLFRDFRETFLLIIRTRKIEGSNQLFFAKLSFWFVSRQ